MMDEELLIKLANDIWEIGKQFETDNYQLSKTLKIISGCIHDMRAGRDTEWYKKYRVV